MWQSYALEKTIGDEAQEEVALEWLGVLQDYLGGETENVEAEGADMVYFTSRSLDDALAESVAGETFLFVATCETGDPRPGKTCFGRDVWGCLVTFGSLTLCVVLGFASCLCVVTSAYPNMRVREAAEERKAVDGYLYVHFAVCWRIHFLGVRNSQALFS